MPSAHQGGAETGGLGPLANVGALALSAYSLQIVAIAVLGYGDGTLGAWLELILFCGAALVLATVWRRRSRRGPFEALLHVSSTRAAVALVPDHAR